MLLPTNRPPTHPGEMLLEEYLKPRGLTQTEAAGRMGIPLRCPVVDEPAERLGPLARAEGHEAKCVKCLPPSPHRAAAAEYETPP